MTGTRVLCYLFGIIGILIFIGGSGLPMFIAGEYMILGLLMILGSLFYIKLFGKPVQKATFTVGQAIDKPQ